MWHHRETRWQTENTNLDPTLKRIQTTRPKSANGSHLMVAVTRGLGDGQCSATKGMPPHSYPRIQCRQIARIFGSHFSQRSSPSRTARYISRPASVTELTKDTFETFSLDARMMSLELQHRLMFSLIGLALALSGGYLAKDYFHAKGVAGKLLTTFGDLRLWIVFLIAVAISCSVFYHAFIAP